MKRTIIWFLLICLSAGAMAVNTKETYNMKRALEAAQSGESETAIRFLSKELDENPTNGYAHMWVALLCTRNNSVGWAFQYAQSAIKYLPKKEYEGRSDMNILLSEIYLDAKDTARAITYMEQAQKEMPKAEHPYRVLVRLNSKRGDKAKALHYAEMALKNQPKSIDAQLLLTDALEENGQYEEALKHCNKALDMAEPQSKDKSRVYAKRALLLIGMKQPSEALADLMRSTRIDIWDVSEDILEQLHDTIPGEVLDTVLAAHEQEPEQLYWKIYLYDLYRYRKEYTKAAQMGFAILPQHNGSHIVHHIASLLEFHIGDSELAERMLLKQLGVDSTSASTYVRLEELYAETGRYREAFDMADKALSFNPKDAEKASAYQLRGRIYQIQHNYPKAIDDFLAGMIADPRDYEYWFRIGRLYGEMNDTVKQAQAFDQGRKAFAAAGKELTPEAYVAMGDSAKAYEAAQKMMKKEDSEEQHYNTACVYAQIGASKEALFHLRKAFENGFRDFYHVAWDMDLDSLREMQEFKDMVNEFKQLTEQEKQALRATLDLELNY